ncbi:hypothetical protein [Paenibacillus caseinilyticus]|uniref:hypothetical protein n=1 Tax=Paenibacillus caseinilyticus TaxID=3098138 RepID=UPI0022B908CA|nr:hypothetical protein [Paenibacillus caseinilyticus]MCZ8518863.1 hypothetical protein [Paenibacillus caseinilyticus]
MEITIKAPELAGALNNLADALRTLSASGNCVAELIENGLEAHKQEIGAGVQETASSKQRTSPTPQEKAAVSAPSQSEEQTEVTVEELRAKAAEVAKSGKQEKVKALLAKFDAKAVSSVPEDQRSAFYNELVAL